MRTPHDEELLTIQLPRWQLGIVAFACRALRKKAARNLEKTQGFVPAPGRQNIHQVYTDGLAEILPAIRRTMGETEDRQ